MLDAVEEAAADGEPVENAADAAVALDQAVLFDTAKRTDVNAGPRPAAGSSRLHSRGVFEALRRVAVLCSTGQVRIKVCLVLMMMIFLI